eukprot:6486852-Amphidinium_carterae.1
MLVLDVKDAFFKLPLTQVERKYAVARISAERGYSYLVYTRPPQGAKNAPQVWGRLAALTGRLCQSLFDSSRVRLELYESMWMTHC